MLHKFAQASEKKLFFRIQRFKVCSFLRINLFEIITIDFDSLKLVCRAMGWIQAIHMEPQRLIVYAFIAL